jgi:ABC-type uncharacterized transport system auxiliary subunit
MQLKLFKIFKIFQKGSTVAKQNDETTMVQTDYSFKEIVKRFEAHQLNNVVFCFDQSNK